jgi:hypothetical protein
MDARKILGNRRIAILLSDSFKWRDRHRDHQVRDTTAPSPIVIPQRSPNF